MAEIRNLDGLGVRFFVSSYGRIGQMKQLLILIIMAFPAMAMATDTIPSTPQKQALYDDLISEMACGCGCGTTLKTCPHENCSHAVPARKEILGYIDGGLGREEIKAKMVATHGEAILAQPMFRGFNIVAWVTPFIVILVVGYLVALVIKKWTSGRVATSPREDAAKTEAKKDDPYIKKMRDELDKFED